MREMHFFVPLLVHGAVCAYLGAGEGAGHTGLGAEKGPWQVPGSSTWKLLGRRVMVGREERGHRSFSP